MSADLVYLRNKFDVIPIVVQQVGTEAINRTSQLNRMIDIGPEDFSDTKYIYRDCNVCLTLVAPFMFDGIREYRQYEVSKAFRYLKCIKNRDGNTYFGKGMYLNGISGTAEELPDAKLLSAQDYDDIKNFRYNHTNIF